MGQALAGPQYSMEPLQPGNRPVTELLSDPHDKVCLASIMSHVDIMVELCPTIDVEPSVEPASTLVPSPRRFMDPTSSVVGFELSGALYHARISTLLANPLSDP